MKNKIAMSMMLAGMLGLGNVPKLPTPKAKKRSFFRWTGLLSGNWRKPHQSAREKMRRVRQGKAGTCYVHRAQYRD